jgi:hypothetical protein
MTIESGRAFEPVLKEVSERGIGVCDRGEAVPDVTGGQHAEFPPQPPGTPAIVGDGGDGGDDVSTDLSAFRAFRAEAIDDDRQSSAAAQRNYTNGLAADSPAPACGTTGSRMPVARDRRLPCHLRDGFLYAGKKPSDPSAVTPSLVSHATVSRRYAGASTMMRHDITGCIRAEKPTLK